MAIKTIAGIFKAMAEQANNLRESQLVSGSAWDMIHQYMKVRTDLMFDRLGQGGSFRGATWAPWSPSSIGRKRPSGKIITASSQLLQDTGHLRRNAANFVKKVTSSEFEFGSRVNYAGEQQETRPFLLWEKGRDENELAKIANEWIVNRKVVPSKIILTVGK